MYLFQEKNPMVIKALILFPIISLLIIIFIKYTVPTKHIMICHAILMLLEDIAKNSKLLDKDLWENLLKFILAINNAVLALPYNKGKYLNVILFLILICLNYFR